MRERVSHSLFIGLAAMSVMAVGSVFAQEGSALEKRGASLLTTNCSRCHAVGRTGASAHPAAPPFRTLSQEISY